MVAEAHLEAVESGLTPASDGWFVVNVRDAAWLTNDAFGARCVFEADEPDHVEDIGAHLDTKVAALLAHKSQFRSTMRIDEGAPLEQVERFRRRVTQQAAERGRRAGVAYGEDFKLVRDI